MSQLILTAGRATAKVLGTQLGNIGKMATKLATNAALAKAQALIYGPAKRRQTGPRIDTFRIQSSTQGNGIARVYGRVRLAGQMIWASNFKETIATQTAQSGGNGKGGGSRVETTTTTYLYSISLAISLCEGEIDRIARVWADGKLIDISRFDYRLYTGTMDQVPDALIEAIEGVDAAPAYRGVAYLVFENLPLAEFGNRVPQFNFEVERSLHKNDTLALENNLTAISVIPASGEEVYAMTPILRDDGLGRSISENVHHNMSGTDFEVSMNQLQSTLPNCRSVALLVSWFGTDLRAGHCQLHPGVETRVKTTTPRAWSVGNVSRQSAYLISQIMARPSYGGTPSDASVVEAIRNLSARGMSVLFHPFILMDIPDNSGLPGLTGTGEQPAYPWRGRIAPDQRSLDSDVAAFFGQASTHDFQVFGTQVSYHGPDEWSLRRMILHYAYLCKAAGGVEAFLIGSEMKELTIAMSSAGIFPAVEAYRSLLLDVRHILGDSVKLSYGADWSEYAGVSGVTHPADRYFHLDPLWAEDDIDFIGINNYMPLSDWRGSGDHLDAQLGFTGIYDRDYLASQIRGAEGFDWYYANETDRRNQLRSPIQDGAYGEDWIYRYKDIWSWWGEVHHNRPNGVRDTTVTPWIPESKPVRFTEIGCGAVTFASNQPNVFFDTKSTEGAKPYFSSGERDDLIQRRFIETHLSYWQHPENNPVSSLYGGTMVSAAHLYVYAWDARPFPDFPARHDVWADGENWTYGHWLNGRAGRVSLETLIANLVEQVSGVTAEVEDLGGLVTGYVIDQPLSPREMIEPLSGLYQFDVVERQGKLVFKARRGVPLFTLGTADLVAQENGADLVLSRAQTTDLPGALSLLYIEDSGGYDMGVAAQDNPAGGSDRHVRLEVPVVMDSAEAGGRVGTLMAEALVMRDEMQFALPPQHIALEPGDVVRLSHHGLYYDMRITEMTVADHLEISAVRTSHSIYDIQYAGTHHKSDIAAPVFGPPLVHLLDVPLFSDQEQAVMHVAATASPWPGEVAVYTKAGEATSQLREVLRRPAMVGQLVLPLAGGVTSRWDRANAIHIRVPENTLTSVERVDVLNGQNRAFVQSKTGEWEIIQFQYAALQTDGTWKLHHLLRGLSGTELEAQAGADQGAGFVLADSGLGETDIGYPQMGLSFTWLVGPASHTTGDPSFVSQVAEFEGIGLRPLSPVHAVAVWSDDDIAISWIRRGRIGGDVWGAGDVPLGEESERYQVEILQGTTPIRRWQVNTPRLIYKSLDIKNDFSADGIGDELQFRVAQLSQIYGAGRWLETRLPLLSG